MFIHRIPQTHTHTQTYAKMYVHAHKQVYVNTLVVKHEIYTCIHVLTLIGKHAHTWKQTHTMMYLHIHKQILKAMWQIIHKHTHSAVDTHLCTFKMHSHYKGALEYIHINT